MCVMWKWEYLFDVTVLLGTCMIEKGPRAVSSERAPSVDISSIKWRERGETMHNNVEKKCPNSTSVLDTGDKLCTWVIYCTKSVDSLMDFDCYFYGKSFGLDRISRTRPSGKMSRYLFKIPFRLSNWTSISLWKKRKAYHEIRIRPSLQKFKTM